LSGVPSGAVPSDERLTELAVTLAATRRGTLGQPRSFAVGVDGERICFLRSIGPDDSRQGLWLANATGEVRLLVDPQRLGDEVDVDDVERARRERTREQATGLTAFSGTPNLDTVTFTYNGRIHVVATDEGHRRTLDVAGPAVDPRPSPTGEHIAWVAGGALHVANLDGSNARVLAQDPDPDVTWGLAEFIAAEEMDRLRGFWWSPDGTALAACRVDVRPVQRWWLHDPSDPQAPPTTLRYPAAGTANAIVGLAAIGLDGSCTRVVWDGDALHYIAGVDWSAGSPLTVAMQSRDQRRLDVLVVDDHSRTHLVRSIRADPWVTLVEGTPRWTSDGRLVTVEDDREADTRRVVVGGQVRSPAGLHIDAVLAVRTNDIVVAASADDPTATVVWSVPLDSGPPRPLSDASGVHHAVISGDTMVTHAQRGHETATRIMVRRHAVSPTALPVLPVEMPFTPRPIFATLPAADLRAALVLPTWFREGEGGDLPVLLDPYGGPHARRVRQASLGFLTSQWFAEAGFAVLVIDGRGTPGRGLAWEHAIAGDLSSAALEDQIAGLHAAAARWPMLDLSRVAIRGWSFGGFLAALAVLRRPDVFHAAIAGAPVSDWRLYDTHYTERYLGDPADEPAAYKRSSLLADATHLQRPLMLLHGFADDNVVAAHTLRLSEELLRAGRPHTVLPLPNTTHVTRDPRQQARLMTIQLDFIRHALGIPSQSTAPSQ
jgi:dipeptidyl-peptidase-4